MDYIYIYIYIYIYTHTHTYIYGAKKGETRVHILQPAHWCMCTLVQEKDANGLKRCVVKDVEEDSPGTFFFPPSLSSLSLLSSPLLFLPPPLSIICAGAQ